MKIRLSRLILASAISAVVIVGGIYLLHHPTPGASAQVAASTPVPPCVAPASSFCATQSRVLGYVQASDFSDIVEQQVATDVTCGNMRPAPSYCNGIANGTQISVFAVADGTLSEYLPRNSYVALFSSFAAAFGPLKFTGDTGSTNDVTMHFAHGTKTYQLLFELTNGMWKVSQAGISG